MTKYNEKFKSLLVHSGRTSYHSVFKRPDVPNAVPILKTEKLVSHLFINENEQYLSVHFMRKQVPYADISDPIVVHLTNNQIENILTNWIYYQSL